MTEKKKGFDLAAALGAVSNLDTGAAEGREQIEYIDIELIRQDERNFYDLPGIEELAANIEFVGLQQPLRVRAEGDTYIIISGHRRHCALSMLVGEGKARYRQVPCIVERPSGQTTAVEVMLQELRLIYGNSDTRRMSSADLSKQAERVEMLLYQLKEAGVEFPGKMRDHVAEACKVSASKLARLKVIREKLDKVWEKDYQKNKLTESAAYTLAQMPAEHQQLIRAAVDDGVITTYDSTLQEMGKRLARIDKLKCTQAGHKGECLNRAGQIKKAMSIASYYTCHCGDCCANCPDLATCKNACPLLEEQVRKMREKARRQKAKEKAAQDERDRPVVDRIKALWQRAGQARELAGISIEEWFQVAGYPWQATDEATIKRHARRESGAEKFKPETAMPFGYPNEWHIKALVHMADTLGVSIDYLLCRTDEPGGGAARGQGEPPKWTPGTAKPSRSGPYLVKLDPGNGESPVSMTVYWDGLVAQWRYAKHSRPVEDRCLAWYPLPDDGGPVGA